MGMGEMVFAIGADQWFSLMGYVIFGVITGLIFLLLTKRL